jgi:hypothetical protein
MFQSFKLKLKSKRMNYECKVCEKKYTQKCSYQNHAILCEFLKNSKRENAIEEEESTDLPSYKDLVKLVGMLAVKNNKLEEKVESLQKWVEKSKKKVNILEWLNTNVKPILTFAQFLESIVLSENHVNCLNEHNMMKTLTTIFEEYFKKENNIPVYAFKEKQNIFYWYNQETNSWSEMEKDKVVSMIYYIDREVQREISAWSMKYHEKIKYNDKWAQTFNKLIGKANTLSYRDDATLSKLKGILFNLLKCDIKRYVEYEFEY